MLKFSFRNLLNILIFIRAAFHVLRFRLLTKCGVITFQQASEAISRIPLWIGYRVRARFYRSLLAFCGDRLEMNFGATISELNARIGNDVWIGPHCYLDLVEIEDQVLIGPSVCILAGGKHHKMERVDIPIRLQGNYPLQRIRIGYGAWIGANAVVMSDVGEGAVVGAGSVVTRPVPPIRRGGWESRADYPIPEWTEVDS